MQAMQVVLDRVVQVSVAQAGLHAHVPQPLPLAEAKSVREVGDLAHGAQADLALERMHERLVDMHPAEAEARECDGVLVRGEWHVEDAEGDGPVGEVLLDAEADGAAGEEVVVERLFLLGVGVQGKKGDDQGDDQGSHLFLRIICDSEPAVGRISHCLKRPKRLIKLTIF